ncbi:MAG: hypothetical protein HKM95_10890, partial [Inquilinus sp.]|nr:hypothetical protein [Inquilinus sp.]
MRRAPKQQMADIRQGVLPLGEAPPRHAQSDPGRQAAERPLDIGRRRLTITGVLFVLAFATVATRLVDLSLIRAGAEPRLASADTIAAPGRRGAVL